jgi:hypothetical protein
MADQVSVARLRAETQHTTKKLEMGLMGVIFGDATEKPGNVAAVAILLSFIALVIIFCSAASDIRGQAIALFGSIITGSIGYLFGRKG